MMGSLSWRLFFAAMLLMGVFAVLRGEGETVPESTPDVAIMQGVTPSASVAGNVQVDSPVYAEAAYKVAAAEVGQTTVEQPPDASEYAEATGYHFANIDKPTLATNQARAFHMLTFQARSMPAHVLEAQRYTTATYRGTAEEGRAHAPRLVPGSAQRRLS